MFNCHASSTIVGDISEARGIRNIMTNKRTFDDLDALATCESSDIKPEDVDFSLSKNAPLNALKPYIAHS